MHAGSRDVGLDHLHVEAQLAQPVIDRVLHAIGRIVAVDRSVDRLFSVLGGCQLRDEPHRRRKVPEGSQTFSATLPSASTVKRRRFWVS